MNGAGETAQLKISHIGKSSALFLLLTLWDFALGILTYCVKSAGHHSHFLDAHQNATKVD
jgi:hypothetical protein